MSMEFNKIFAAVLTAGIIAWLSWFVAHEAYHSEPLEKNAFEIAVADDAGASAGPAAATGPEPIDIDKGDLAQGEKISKVCSSCHTFEQGGANKVGPNLFGIFGNIHAHKDDYSYSDGMKAHKGEKWDVDALNHFLWSPRKTIEGTKMTFAGLPKAEDRAAIIKWLSTQK